VSRSVRRVLLVFAAVGASACAEGPPAHSSAPVVPIKSACTAKAATPGSVGFDVRPGRRHSEAQTIFVTNLTDAPHTVRVQQVSRVEGPCSADWARQTPLEYVDGKTCELPEATTLAPKEFERVEIGAQRVHATWPCTKMGIALWMKVDDEVVCADAGSGIATQDSGDE
jgi:hypothetical protein